LNALGGRLIPPGLWDELRGMDDVKEIIERRVILPLAEPELAARHAVAPPKAIVLFGPPGTGKTTFAKGIASRLGWPFVEIEPAEIGAEGAERQAKLLAETFDRLLELPAAVVFVDEVEDLASIRQDERRVSPSITNEFLKQIPRMRDAPHHLLACATNSVGLLDPAFLRPGRFDYVLPVGPPNDDARAAVWGRYVDEITDQKIDIAVLVAASQLFTPADIEWAARKAAQRAFEREHFEGKGSRATTDDFLVAIADTRTTLTPAMIKSFEADTARFSRA
jgi:SpoVK/Ycf46/Vps4 family AAA+-type ATPase